jgi:hypothetical protein
MLLLNPDHVPSSENLSKDVSFFPFLGVNFGLPGSGSGFPSPNPDPPVRECFSV